MGIFAKANLMRPGSSTSKVLSFLLSVLLGTSLLTAFQIATTPDPANAVACASGMSAQGGLTATPSHGQVFYIDSGVTPKVDASYVGYQIAGSSTQTVWASLESFTGGKVQLANPADQYQQIQLTSSNSYKMTAFYLLKALGSTTTSQTHTLKIYDRRPDLSGATASLTCTFTFSKVAETIKASSNKVNSVTVTNSGSTAKPTLGGTVTLAITAATGKIGNGSAPDNALFWASPAAQSTWPTQALRLESTSISLNCANNTTYAPTLTLTNRLTTSGTEFTSGCTNQTNQTWTASYVFRVIGPGASVTPSPVAVISSGTQYKHSDLAIATNSTIDLTGVSPVTTAVTTSVTLAAAADTVTPYPDSTHARVKYTATVSTNSTAAISVDELVAKHSTGSAYVANSTRSGLGTASNTGPEPSEVATETGSPKPQHFIGPFTGIQTGASTSYKLTYNFDIPCDGTTYTASIYAYVGATMIAKDAGTASGISVSATTSGGNCTAPTIVVVDPSLNPTVSTSPATGVDSTSATLNGYFNASGNSGVTQRFIWGTDPNLVGATQGTWTSITGTSAQALTQALTGLSSATTYYFQAQIKNSSGTITSGLILNFKTWDVQKDPTATTLAATGVTTNAVTMNGTFNPNGIPITGVFFRYSASSTVTSGALSGTNYELQVQVDNGSGTATNLTFAAGSYGDVPVNTDDPITAAQYSPTGTGQQNPVLSGTYYYQIRLTCTPTSTFCANGYINGPVLSFTMGSATATTLDATSVADTTATLNGTVKSPTTTASSTSIKFCYNTSNAVSATTGALTSCLNSGPTAANTASISQNTTQTTYLNITGLTHGTVYYFQVIAQVGTGTITYGSVFAFQTLDITTTSVPAGVVGTAYAKTLQGVGGSTTYTWALTSGSLPPGVTLGSNGLLSGTPTTSGSYSITVTMTDASTGMTTSETFTITVSGAPTVTTSAASSVTGTSAVMNGAVNPNGDAITSASWCWGTSPSLTSCTVVLIPSTTYNTWNTAGQITASNATTASLSGLTNGTTYYYKLTAQNNNGTVSSSPIIQFSTTGAPSVATSGATLVTGSTTTLTATISPNGASISAAQICYGATSGSMTTCANIAENYAGWSTSSSNNSATLGLTGLTPGATYYYKVTATNANGSAESVGASFTMASATTSVASGVGNTTATLPGTLNAGSSNIATGDITKIELCYSASSTVTGTLLSANDLTCTTVTKSAVNAGTNGAFSLAATGLTAGTQYWFQIKVTFANTTVINGSTATFTTLAAPAVTTTPASSVGITTGTMNGTVDAKGSAITSATFCYSSTDSTLTTCTSVTVDRTGWTTGSGNSATYQLNGLSSGTKYYYKLTAVNGIGTGTSATPHQNFTTMDAPAVAVLDALRVTSKGATLKGSVDRKSAKLSKITFCWSPNPISGTSCTDAALDDATVTTINNGNSGAQISKVMTNLLPGHTYYYMVTATSGNGGVNSASVKTAGFKKASLFKAAAITAPDVNVYSSTASFTTAGAVTNSATNVGATGATINGTLNASSSGLASGDVTNVQLCYSTSNATDPTTGLLNSSPICSSNLWNSGSIAANGSQAYSVATGTLTPSTIYYSQIQTTFYDGSTANGAVVDFTTAALPSATTNAATSVSKNAAVLNGSIDVNGTTVSSVWFCYSTASDLSNCTSASVTRPSGGWVSGTYSVSTTVSTLSSSTKYYFKVYATNDYGTVTGSILNFTTYSVLTFDSNGGSAVNPINHAASTPVAKPTDPTRDGYTFAGWYNSSNQAVTWSYTSSIDETLTAHWTPITYNVYYDEHGGTAVADGTFSDTNRTVTFPTAPTRDGYTFAGWFTAATGGDQKTGTSFTAAGFADITLHAQWTAIEYKVVFDTDQGSTVNDKTFIVGGSITKPTDPTKAGYHFDGWYDAAAPSGTLITWTSGSWAPGVTHDVTLYAHWTAYTVTFSNGTYGGTLPSPNPMSGSIAHLPTDPGMTPQASGYTFAGWACPTGSATLAAGSAFTPTSNVTCTAVWTPPNSNTVTFNSNYPGASPSNTTSTQSNNVQANLASNTFAISGYTFAGWSSSSSSNTIAYANNASYNFAAGGTQLYAVWTPVSYNVVFNAQGGTTTASKSYTTGGSVTAPTVPTKAGYTFNGWFDDPNAGNQITFDYSPPVGGITLYAQWSPDPKTVTFHSNYPTGTNSTTTQSNYVTTQLDAQSFSINGYTFAHWAVNQDGTGTQYAANASYNFLATLGLWAVWTPLSNPVTYNTQGGTSVANGSYLTGGSITLASAPTRTGYVFAGWFLNSAGGSALGATYTPSAGTTGTIPIFAQWTPGTNTVVFDPRGGSPAPADGSYTTGSSVSAPVGSDPTKTANEFKGWFLATSGGSHLNFPYAPGTVGTLTLYAQWSPWAVTFALGAGGTTPATGSAPATMYGVVNSLPGQGSMIAPAGYEFEGWTCSGSATVYPEAASITPTGATTCTASWRVSSARTITFHSNYPAGSNSTTTQSGSAAANLNRNPFVAGGFAFGGWATSPTGGVVYTDEQSYDFVLSGDLYAVWHRQSSGGDPAYVINFLYEGGEEGMKVTYYTIGAPGISLPTSQRPGYTFKGWAPAPASSSTVTAPFTTAANVTLFAQWMPNTVTITFHYLGGTQGVTSMRYTVGKPGLSLPTSTKSGFGFAGWSLVNGGSDPVYEPYAPTKDVNLYAIWNGTHYTVTLIPGGGSPYIVLQYTIGGPGLTLPKLTDPNLTFIGWNPNTNATSGVKEPYKPTRSIKMYPVWQDDLANTLVYFGGDSPVIDYAARLKLRALAKKVTSAKSHIQFVVDGWVKETINKSYDQQLSAQRAKNAASYLRSIGVDAFARIQPRGISPENSAISRRANISVYYSGPDKKKA